MSPNTQCNLTPVQESQEMIRTILADITINYMLGGGGGISKIKLTATNVYVVNISQEERVDQITYEMDLGQACKAIVKKSTSSAISKKRH